MLSQWVAVASGWLKDILQLYITLNMHFFVKLLWNNLYCEKHYVVLLWYNYQPCYLFIYFSFQTMVQLVG